jgi:hypothetical protein
MCTSDKNYYRLFYTCCYSIKFTPPDDETRTSVWQQTISWTGLNYILGWHTMKPDISLLMSIRNMNKLLDNYTVTLHKGLYSSQSLPWEPQISHTLERGHSISFWKDGAIRYDKISSTQWVKLWNLNTYTVKIILIIIFRLQYKYITCPKYTTNFQYYIYIIKMIY